MNENKKACPSAATPEQAKNKAITGNALSYSNTKKRLPQGFIVSYLHCGEDNAISAKELKIAAGLSSERFLRLIIDRERQNGAVILSSDNGYYLPSEDKQTAMFEIKRYIARFDKRMISNRNSIREAKNALRTLQNAENERQYSFFNDMEQLCQKEL